MKHEREIKKWAEMPDGTFVFYKGPGEESWTNTRHPIWEEQVVYVVSDEWAKLRMAFYDGELQVYRPTGWCDYPSNGSEPKWEYPINQWRRKPKFEPGEWVRDKNSDMVIRAYDDMISDNFERWSPRRGELCVFWNDEGDKDVKFVIARLSSIDNTQRTFRYIEMHAHCGRYIHCAPIEFAKELKR